MHRRLADTEEPEYTMTRHALPIVLLLVLPLSAQAAGLGRLFFSPQQRAQLDYQQAQNATYDGSTQPSSGLTVNGIVQKDGGKRTIWINGVPRDAGNSDERHPESTPVAVPGHSQPIRIKVGQKMLPDESPPPEPPPRR
jgi:hypothetical protein